MDNPAESVNSYLRAAGFQPDVDFSAKATAIEYLDGTAWSKYFYPHLFSRPFTSYQQDFWAWGDLIEANKYYRPRIECEPRGVGKSTNAEALAVKLVATKKRKMIGYVSLNEEKAGKHFDSIKSMLESDKLLSVYPHCAPKVQKLRDSAAQWSRDAIVTQSGAMVVPLTLLGSSRGWKSADGTRFDVIFLDDIDALGQSSDFTKKLIELLKGEILAAGDDNTLVIMPQNLIHRDSICTQILDHRADILSDRIFCGPFPLLKDYDAEKVNLPDGAKKWTITRGEAFDEAIDIAYAEKLLNKFGKALFDRECQQKVFEVEDDKDFREWDERFHLITESEFRREMAKVQEPIWNEQRNCLQIPVRWNVGVGFDWGTTKGHPSAIAFVGKPSEHSPFKNFHFVFGEVVKPKYPLDSFEKPEIVSVGRVAKAIKDFLNLWNVADRQVIWRLMSHEASAALNTMAIDLNEDIQQFFGKWKAEKGSGVPQIQNLLEIDYTKPHPFRRYPAGYIKNGIDMSSLPLQGCPKMFFIVADGQGELQIDASSELYVVGAIDSRGFSRARLEMPLYSHKAGGQNKSDDDFVDGLRGLMNKFGVPSQSKTTEERIEDKLDNAIKLTTVELMPDSIEKDGLIQRRRMEIMKLQKDMSKPVRHPGMTKFSRR